MTLQSRSIPGGVSLYLRQLEIGPMGNFIYLVGDREKKECLMVDPAWDVDAVLEVAEKDGMKVLEGVLTHTHFDHVNGAAHLAARTGGGIYVHQVEADFLKGIKCPVRETHDGSQLSIGKVRITFLHTPGHTPGSQCLLVEETGGSKKSMRWLLSGDTLFINACGRCDLEDGDPGQMYESLCKLAKLDDETIVLPGHDYGENSFSTIGREKKNNPYYQCSSRDEFLHERMGM